MKNLFLLFLFIAPAAFAQKPEEKPHLVTEKEFKAHIDSVGLKFEMPAGYKPVMVKPNNDLWYDFAIMNADSTFEVRYTVWSLKPALAEYEKCKLDSNCLMVHPNVIFKGRAEANVLNMSGGVSYDIGGFPKAAVKKEFGADVGGSCFLEFNCAFGKGYKYGQFMILHKDNVADAIVTFMSHDREKHPDFMMEAFHSLTFK